MEVHIELNPSQTKAEIIIKIKEITEEIQQLLKIIEGRNVNQIVGVLNQ
ncbi:response regulator [Bacillus clarus]|uniref:Response regulator n=1 Tax=Bacillus clarus TaxID=2338372 RepID=A0A090ZHA4_9BACI|nr:response regulator [Bacillus clarus]